MTRADLYAIMTLLHIGVDLVFVAGLLMLALLVAALAFQPAASLARERGLIEGVRRWDRRVTTPALGLAWLLGLGLAGMAGWFGAGWLTAKLVLVLGLSGLHGVLGGVLRRALGTPPRSPARGWAGGAAGALIVVAAVVWLVLLKPF